MRPMNLANKKFVPTPYLFTQTNKLGEHQVGAESFHFSYLWEKMGFLEKSRLGWKVLHWLSTGLELASWQSLNQHWRLSHLCKQSGVSFVAVTNQNQLFRMFVEIITFTWYSSRIWILAALVVWGNKKDQGKASSCVIRWYSSQGHKRSHKNQQPISLEMKRCHFQRALLCFNIIGFMASPEYGRARQEPWQIAADQTWQSWFFLKIRNRNWFRNKFKLEVE